LGLDIDLNLIDTNGIVLSNSGSSEYGRVDEVAALKI